MSCLLDLWLLKFKNTHTHTDAQFLESLNLRQPFTPRAGRDFVDEYAALIKSFNTTRLCFITYIDYQGHQESCISSISLTVQHNHINQTTTSWYPVLLFYLHLLRHLDLELLRRWLGLPWRASSCCSEIRFLGICWELSVTVLSLFFLSLSCQSF